MIIDFSSFPERKKAYGGANGSKLSIVYNNEIYMLKMPTKTTKNPNMSYANSCISEYLGCHIFNMLNVKAQETILGQYNHNGINRVAVACKDFTSPNTILLDFASIKNQIIDSSSNGYGTEIEDILITIRKQTSINPNELEQFFWNVFVIDAFIGNWDRHNGNWGFLYNQQTDDICIAPIFDCGSSLFPQMDENMLKKVIASKAEMETRVYNVPTSAIVLNGKRINYYTFVTSLEYEGCNAALKRIVPLIDLAKINELIDSVEQLSSLNKEFLKKILKMRKELILDAAFKKLSD